MNIMYDLSDGISAFRKAISGKELPNPRLVRQIQSKITFLFHISTFGFTLISFQSMIPLEGSSSWVKI